MKARYSILIVLFVLFNKSITGQIAFHDAIEIQNEFMFNGQFVFDDESLKSFSQILSNYTHIDQESEEYIVNLSLNNPFLKDFIPEMIRPALETNMNLTNADSGLNFLPKASFEYPTMITQDRVNTLPPTRGFSASMIADETAKFLVSRTKQELNIAFFDKFKRTIAKYPEFSVLFPTTSGFLEYLEPYNYEHMLQVLKEAFASDLGDLPGNIPKLRTELNCLDDDLLCKKRFELISNYFANNSNSTVLIISCILVDQIIKGNSPADAFHTIATDESISNSNGSNYANAMVLTDLVSSSMRSDKIGQIWITKQELDEFLKNDNNIRIYYGLLYLKSQSLNIKFSLADNSTVIFSTILSNIEDDVTKMKNFLTSVQSFEARIDLVLNKTREDALHSNTDITQYIQEYLNSIIGMIETITNVDYYTKDINYQKAKNEIQVLINNSKTALKMYDNIRLKNYNSLVYNAIILFENTLDSKEYQSKKDILKYGPFIASFAQASSAIEVQKAIETFAMPPRSALVKRKKRLDVSLNAYVGGFYGHEWLNKYNDEPDQYDIENNAESIVGITSPIGIAFSYGGWSINKYRDWSLSLFVSVIDIGALTAFRFDDTNNAAIPEFELKNIIAPGFSFILGIPSIPLSFGTGYQYGPSLRKINIEIVDPDNPTEDMIKYDLADGYRWSVFLAVDIPLINIYTRNK